MNKKFSLIMAIVAGGSLLAACSAVDQRSNEGEDGGGTVTILTHDSFAISDERKAAFEEESGYKLQTTAPGDAGMVVNQLILNKDNPTVDGVYGVDSFSAHRAVSEGVFEDYTSDKDPGDEYALDGLTPIDQGDVCVNVDHEWFEENGVAEPSSFEDLIKPEYKGLFVTLNPATSGTGLSFLVGTVDHFGDDWQSYWNDLLANDAKVSDSWSDAYYTDFSGADGEGAFPLVLSYSSSPAESGGATGSIEGTCTRTVEYAGVVKGGANPEGAKAFIDFLLEEETQETLPESMYMYPIVDGVDLPEEWAKHAELTEDAIWPDPANVADNRETWIQEWTELYEAAR